jgi:uncharacterized protein YjdB
MNQKNNRWLRSLLLFVMAWMLVFPLSAQAATVKLNKTSISLSKGKTYTLKLSGTSSKVTWSTSDKSVATVTTKGKVTAKKAGTATITATAGGQSYTCTVTVKQLVTSIKMQYKNVKISQGKTFEIQTTVSPATATNKLLTWTSSNKKVATVDANGKVTAVSSGTATITAKAKDGSGKSVSCKITVKEPFKISSSSLTLTEGESGTLTVSGTYGAKVTWASTKTSIATVTSSGKVTAKSAGTAVVSAKLSGTGQTVYCQVTVNAKTVSTSVTAKKFLEDLEKISQKVQSDYASGTYWTYNNSAPSTWQSAVSSGNRSCNCALLARWALRDLGVINSKNFWGVLGGGITFRGDVEAQLKKHCEIIKVYKTPNQLLAEGNLLPGDICTWVEIQHTNVYAGDGLWYDAGRTSVNGKYVNGKYVFTTFGPVASMNMSNYTVGYIIRIVK